MRVAVGIAVPIAQHHVMFGAQVIVAAIFGKCQTVQEKAIAGQAGAHWLAGVRFAGSCFSSFCFADLCFSKQRPPRAGQRFFLDLAQGFEQILPSLAQDDLFPHLEGGHALAILHSFALPHAFVSLEQNAAALQHLRELLVHLHAQEFGHREARQQVDRNVFLFFRAIQRGQMQFSQQRLPVRLFRWIASRPGGRVPHPRRALRFLLRLRRQHSFQLAVADNQSHHVCARRLYEARAQGHIMA